MTHWVYTSKNSAWDGVRADELFGDSRPIKQELRKELQKNASSVMQNLHIEVLNLIHIKDILGFLRARNLLTNGELHDLSREDFDHDRKTLLLAAYVYNKPKTPIERFYLCLLDSYSRPGLEGHYQLAHKIREESLSILGKNALDIIESDRDVKEVVKKIKGVSVKLNPSVLHDLVMLLDVSTDDSETLPSDLYSVCQKWYSTATDPDLATLIRALLCTQGLGHLVTGLVPICYSNPPSVCKFLEKYKSKWSQVAVFLGYNKELIGSLISRNQYSLEEQIRYFQRVWWVPDCGEQLEDILQNLADCAGLNSSNRPCSTPIQTADAEQPTEPIVEYQVAEMYTYMKPQQWKVGRRKWHLTMDEVGAGATPKPVVFEDEKDDEEEDPIPDGSTNGQLLEACLQKDWGLANVLIDPARKEAMKCRDERRRTPLLICCLEKQVELVEKLLQNGADVRARDEAGDCCLYYHTVLNDVQLLSMLLDAFVAGQVCVDFRRKNYTTPLLVACFIGDGCAASVELLLKAGANPNGDEEALYRPLTVACAGGHTRIAKLLLEHSANIDIQDKEGRTPLICACLRYHSTLAKLLIQKGAQINITDKSQTSALFACSANNCSEMTEFLIQKGAHVNIKRFRGDQFSSGSVEETPLAHACATGNLEMVKLLVENGANINQLCSGTVPPVGFAIILHQLHVVKYLTNHRDFNSNIFELARPVIIGVKGQHWQSVQYILEKFFGTAETALIAAGERRFSQLQESIQTYLDIIPSGTADMLRIQTQSEIVEMQQQNERNSFPTLHAGEQYLERFCQICLNTVRESYNFKVLSENAAAEGLCDVANFYMECFHYTQDPVELKTNFLIGDPSALRLLIRKHIINVADFLVHVQRYYQSEAEEFLSKLVLTFHEVIGADYLPFDSNACLQQLFNGAFVPTVSRGPRQDSANIAEVQRLKPVANLQNNLAGPLPEQNCGNFNPYRAMVGGVPLDQSLYDNRPLLPSGTERKELTSAPSPKLGSKKKSAQPMEGAVHTSDLASDSTSDCSMRKSSSVGESHHPARVLSMEAADSTAWSDSAVPSVPQASEAHNISLATAEQELHSASTSHCVNASNSSAVSSSPQLATYTNTKSSSFDRTSSVVEEEEFIREETTPRTMELCHQLLTQLRTSPSPEAFGLQLVQSGTYNPRPLEFPLINPTNIANVVADMLRYAKGEQGKKRVKIVMTFYDD